MIWTVTRRRNHPARLVFSVTAPAALVAFAVAPACARVIHPAAPPAKASHAVKTSHIPSGPRHSVIPAYSHIVIVMEENHSYSQIIGSSSAPYINSLAKSGALFTSSHGVGHPSEPNYMALTGGSTFGIIGDPCPVNVGSANLGSELIAAGHSYSDYSESMPSQGYKGCTSGEYARKHNPAANYTNLPATSNQTWSQFPGNFASLPTVSLVDPNLLDDMHDGTIAQGDTWLKNNLGAYATWAAANNSLLIVTWDENDGSPGNHIATIFVGAHIKTGKYSEKITHYNILRTIEDAYGLGHLGASATATPITDVFN